MSRPRTEVLYKESSTYPKYTFGDLDSGDFFRFTESATWQTKTLRRKLRTGHFAIVETSDGSRAPGDVSLMPISPDEKVIPLDVTITVHGPREGTS